MNALDGVGILFVNNFAGPGLGGGETHLLAIAAACRDAGMGVHVVCEAGRDLEAAARREGYGVLGVRFRGTASLAAVARVRAYMRGRDVRIVHSGGVLSNFVARTAVIGLPVRVVTTVQVELDAAAHTRAGSGGVWLRRTVEGASRTGTDVFVAVSDAIARGLVIAGVPADRVTVVHNGVDADALDRAAAAEAPAGLPGTRPLVGCVARLERVKGVDLFVRVAGVLSRDRPDVSFAVVGDGSQRAELETASRDEGLAGRLAFLGVVASAAPALARFDVCVVPSRSEGLPMVVLEAMALARPVVATAVGGIPEAVDDGATGILVRPEDPEALAAAIGSLLDDRERASAMGRAGRERVGARFSADEQRRRYLEIFAGLLKDGA